MVPITVRIEKEILEKIDKAAEADNRSRNNMVTQIFRSWIDRPGELDPRISEEGEK